MNVSVKRSVALLLTLAKLPNHCVDNEENHSNILVYSTATDKWQNEVNAGAVSLVETQHSVSSYDVTHPLPVA
jgi:hypothetical protein